MNPRKKRAFRVGKGSKGTGGEIFSVRKGHSRDGSLTLTMGDAEERGTGYQGTRGEGNAIKGPDSLSRILTLLKEVHSGDGVLAMAGGFLGLGGRESTHSEPEIEGFM